MKNLFIVGSILLLSCSKQQVSQPTVSPDYLVAPEEDARPVRVESQACLFIDFNGGNVQHALWNNGNAFNCSPSSLSTQNKNAILTRVQQAYSRFKINVTLDATVYNKARLRQRIIVTPSSSWYASSVNGIAFIGSLHSSNPAPGFVFSDKLFEDPKYIGDIAMHETGHTVGLYHQSDYDSSCGLVNSYRFGAIMGYPFNAPNPAWVSGTTTACNVYQNDSLLLQEKLGLR